MKNQLKHEQQELLSIVKEQLNTEQFLYTKFAPKEVSTLRAYAERLGYTFSVNDQRQTIKVYNPENHRYGFIKKLGNTIVYGFMKNSNFIKKREIDLNLWFFKILTRFKHDNNTMLKGLTGILELEFVFTK